LVLAKVDLTYSLHIILTKLTYNLGTGVDNSAYLTSPGDR